ncbi:hypothetical protein [Spirillospora sp. CA-294931]|uniref:hypothetical protein n=1 Tax=Spirillospora sp. CA-294931 TaxID=3240042 RepID=UPI003D8DB39B
MDERAWVEARRALSADRRGWGVAADGLYPELSRVAGTSLLCRPEWVPGAPVPLEDVRLEWEAGAGTVAVRDPSDGLPEGYATYAEAMGALAQPRVFEDRPCYRLVRVDGTTLTLGPARYFDGVNVGEAVAHELAAGVPGLPLRTRVGDPLDFGRRVALPAITTLTLTRSGSYVLHWRDPEKVAHAGGLRQVMPVGVFQPLEDERRDLDLWRTMVREYSEEFLGTSEAYGDGFVQEDWPFHRRLSDARAHGRVRVFWLGMGVDPLTFALDFLTVAVFDDALFRETFAGLVETNDEGRVSTAAFDGTVPQPMQPAGAAALELAWRHRRALGVTPG